MGIIGDKFPQYYSALIRAAESAGAWEHCSEVTGFDVEENVHFKNDVNNKM